MNVKRNFPPRGICLNGLRFYDSAMPKRVMGDRPRQRHFLKQWREFRGFNQSQLAERIGTSVPNVSRVENFKQPYTQDFLELAADALSTDPASIIIRNPLAPDAIWSIWDQAGEGERKQIIDLATIVLRKTG